MRGGGGGAGNEASLGMLNKHEKGIYQPPKYSHCLAFLVSDSVYGELCMHIVVCHVSEV